MKQRKRARSKPAMLEAQAAGSGGSAGAGARAWLDGAQFSTQGCGRMLAAGTEAPSFDRADQRGERVALTELIRRGPVVLYFYPRDFTPVCTKEACLFRDAFEELHEQGVTVVGVSIDDDESHRKFAAKHRLPFSLIADEDRSLAKAYKIVRMFGLGAERATFVIDGKGTIRGAFHHELSAGKHLEDVQRCLEKLRQ